MKFNYQELLDFEILSNTIENYLTFIIVSLIAFLVFKIALNIGLNKLNKLAKKTKTKLDDLAIKILEKIQWAAFTLIVLLTAQSTLEINPDISRIIDIVIIAIITFEIIKIGVIGTEFGTQKILNKKENKTTQGQIIILSKVLKVILWIVGITLFLSNIGYDVTSLIAGLGIGSIAIALAVQNILGDMLSSFSIYFDKPFQVGDSIKIGEYMGNVMNIGVKTTRIKTLQGEELVVPNNKLTNTELQNFGKLKTRRIVTSLGLRYDTTCKKLKKTKEIISKIIKTTKKVELVRIHFKEFGESALIFELVYTVLSDDYAVYMDLQEKINMQIKESLEKENIQFAYPTRTIITEKA